MKLRQMAANLLIIGHALEWVSIIHFFHDLLNIGISLVPKVTFELLASDPWPEIHDRFWGPALMQFRGRGLADGVTLQGVSHTLHLVGLEPKALVGTKADIPRKRLGERRRLVMHLHF
jgi:hypothetical protein